MSMAKFTGLATLLCAVSLFQGAYAVTPGSPSLNFTFEINGDTGVVQGTVTAPLKDNQWQELPAETSIDIRVVRSCYQLSETDIPVVSLENLKPGEARTFTDTAEPAWQYGYQYTYNAYASIDGSEGNQCYGSMTPGISFSFGYNAVTATAKEVDGVFSVDITATVPDKTDSYPAEDIPVDMTALEFYRIADGGAGETVLLGTISDPVKGDTYTYTDNEPEANSENHYLVKAVTKFGMAKSYADTFVGYDVPGAPYPVNGEFQDDGGYRISWTAPTEGMNYGKIDPSQTVYNVYRAWGRGENDRKQIATGIKETEYVDYGTDMEQPRAVMYIVEAANNIGIGDSSSYPYGYEVVIGPASNLPYVETFDGGVNNVWSFDASTYYGKFYTGTYAEFGDSRVDPYSGTGLIYVDYSYSYVSDGSTADMTSFKIDISEAVCPAVSFWLYMIPSGGVTVVPQVAYNGGEFTDLATLNVGDCTEAGWKKFTYKLQPGEGVKNVVLRFHTEKQAGGQAAIFDEVAVLDYKPVGNLDVEYDPENCTASITWKDPSTEYAVVTSYEGYVDGVSAGAVTSPWEYKAADYMTPVQVSVKAIYGELEAPVSAPVTVSVPRPVYTEFTIDEHVFKIVEDAPASDKQVIIKEYLGDQPLYKAPEMVTYDDVTYKVTGIGEGAYRGNNAIASVNISDLIADIAAEAFYGCESLQAVSFGMGLQSIKAKAFADCTLLESVIFKNPVAPEVAEDAFSGISDNCTGKCPEESLEDYKAVAGLNPINFGQSGVDGIDAEEDVEYYNLKGVRIDKPARGTVVIVRGKKSSGVRVMD